MNLLLFVVSVFVACLGQPKQLTVYIFLSTECPLSQEQTLTANIIFEKFKKDVAVVGVFPNKGDDAEAITAFRENYKILFELKADPAHELKDLLHATVTPEAFLVDKQGKVVYSGMIDNRMVSLGKKRSVVIQHFLEDAIDLTLRSKTVRVSKTVPIGCRIFSNKYMEQQ